MFCGDFPALGRPEHGPPGPGRGLSEVASTRAQVERSRLIATLRLCPQCRNRIRLFSRPDDVISGSRSIACHVCGGPTTLVRGDGAQPDEQRRTMIAHSREPRPGTKETRPRSLSPLAA